MEAQSPSKPPPPSVASLRASAPVFQPTQPKPSPSKQQQAKNHATAQGNLAPRPSPARRTNHHHHHRPPHPPQEKIELALANFHFVFASQSAYAEDCKFQDVLKLGVDDFWNEIVLIEYSASYDLLCPLCLDVVQLGEALPCGHVFCRVCIQRCLRFAANDNPMLFKCPVCLEGQLHTKLLRNCVVKRKPKNEAIAFSLVRGFQDQDLIPRTDHSFAFSSRFKIATPKFMLDFVANRRTDLQATRTDLQRFRDLDGLEILRPCDKELDSLYIEWNRQLGKPVSSPRRQQDTKGGGGDKFYQNSDGLLVFVHPVNLKTLALVEPQPLERIAGLEVVEINDWNGVQFPGISRCHAVPLSSAFAELDLTPLHLSSKVMEASKREVMERAKRRMQARTKLERTKLSQAQESERQEQARIAARQQEERLLLDFFGYTEQRVLDEREERARAKPTAPNMFSSVVSQMGHFPALPTNKPAAVAAAPPPPTTAPPPPPAAESFSQATTMGGKKKKVPLFTNNPASRRG